MATESALARRYGRYAVKFIIESDQAPTDANLQAVLSRCVRPARAEEYPRIRWEVLRGRMACGCGHAGIAHAESWACLDCTCPAFAPNLAEFNTATLNLGRFTPGTLRTAEQALEGIAQCDTDWASGELTSSEDMIGQKRTPHWRSGYRLRWLERVAAWSAAEAHEEQPAAGAEGFYVTVKSGRQTGYLLGPYGSKAEAEGKVDLGKQLARQVNDSAHFYAYGVTRVVMPAGRPLPEGKLNGTALVTS